MLLQLNDGNLLPENFEFFFENSICGLLITDGEGAIIKCNNQICLWTGIEAVQLKGKKFADLLTIGGKVYYETHLSPLLQMQGFFDEIVVELINIATQKIRILVNAKEFRDENHHLLYIQYTLVKASDRLQYEKNLQLAKQIAETELLRQKETLVLREQLIAVLGHDLRNPLSAIGMAIEFLQHSLKSTQNIQVVTLLKRSSMRMSELVSHIMDFARTRLGEGIVINLKETMLEPLLKHVIEELQVVYAAHKIITVFELNEPILCDANRLTQLLSNLLANALTHGATDTPVYVYAIYKHHTLHLSVVNSGPPIPENLREKLFAPFTREGSRPSQNGLGLGLYICSEIARAHQAVLTCESNEAETRFILNMPDLK